MEPNLLDFTEPESLVDEESRSYTNRRTIPAGNEFNFELSYLGPEIDVDIQYSYTDYRTKTTKTETLHVSDENGGTFVQFADDSMIFNADSEDEEASNAFEFLDSSFIMNDISDNTFRFEENSLVVDSSMEEAVIKLPIDLYNSYSVDNFVVQVTALRGANITSLSLRRKVYMSAIIWDGVGEKLFETGVDRGVLYDFDTETKTYNNGYAWNGLTAVTESPEGAEPTDLWADNIKYASLLSAEEFGATIEAYTYPKEFEKCDGSADLATGVTIGQQPRATFGFCYRTQIGSDTVATQTNAYKLHLIYGCKASPSEKAYETINDSPDAITFSWEITTTPVPVTGGKPTSCITIDSTKCDKSKLTALEKILYGSDADAEAQTEATNPRLPLPDEIKTLMTPKP